MQIVFLMAGATQETYIKEGLNKYRDRLKHYCSFEWFEVESPKNKKLSTKEALLEAEYHLFAKKILPGDYLVLLDERGSEYTSAGLSAQIERWQHASIKRLIFMIGGAYGFSPMMYKRAQMQISLSKLTFTHQLVRLLLVEQVYRAYSILKNEPYHH